MVTVIVMCMIGIIKAVTFSFSVLYLVYLWVNAENLSYLGSFPTYYRYYYNSITALTFIL